VSYSTVIANVYARLAEGDFKSIFDILAADVQWVEAENHPYSPGAPLVGHDALQTAVFDELAKDFAEFHINVSRIVAGETSVLVEGRYVGTTNTGKDLDAIFAHVWDFDGDRIVHFQQYSDTWQWRRVLGV
jgi:ketosteroid isomerase-like protein